MSHCTVRIIIACVISKVAARAVRAQRGPYLDVIPHSHFQSFDSILQQQNVESILCFVLTIRLETSRKKLRYTS